jgi:serine/threonine protein kinase
MVKWRHGSDSPSQFLVFGTAEVITFVHKNGFVHRHLEPENANILLDARGETRIALNALWRRNSLLAVKAATKRLSFMPFVGSLYEIFNPNLAFDGTCVARSPEHGMSRGQLVNSRISLWVLSTFV